MKIAEPLEDARPSPMITLGYRREREILGCRWRIELGATIQPRGWKASLTA